VVKWQFLSEDGSMAGPRLVEHLRRVGFQEMPEPLARVSWSDHLVAAYTTYLPGARDGWEWMLEDLRRHLDGDLARPDWAPALASLTGRLHAAASTPSAIFPEPVVQAKMAALARHYRTLLLAELDEEMRSALEPWRERFEAAIAVLEQADSIDALPIHGDLHAGQFLLWDGGTFVSDFDGNPLLEPHDRGAPGPSAIDVAGLLRTLDHVAIAAARRSDSEDAMPRARLWAREARSEALEAYRATPGIPTLDLDVLRALETLSPLHEAAYASTYLPRWRYVPLAVLRDSN
jgi:maltokinase